MNHIRITIAIIAALTLSASCGCKPDQAESDTANAALVVDLGAVARALGRDKEISASLSASRTAFNQQLEHAADRLNAQLEQANKDDGKKSAHQDQETLAQLSEQAATRLRQLQQAAQLKLDKQQVELLNAFRDEVKQAAAGVASKRGATVVQLSGGDVLWFDPQSDITGDVIAALRAKNDSRAHGTVSSEDSTLREETTKLNELVDSVKTEASSNR